MEYEGVSDTNCSQKSWNSQQDSGIETGWDMRKNWNHYDHSSAKVKEEVWGYEEIWSHSDFSEKKN